MACYHPMVVYRSLVKKTESGKSFISFNYKDVIGTPYNEVTIPCGQCIGCRIDKSRDWAIRCVHEASCFDENCFLTLTFSDDYLNEKTYPETLVKRDFQLFMKRLRKAYRGKQGVKDVNTGEITYPIRYFHCGEYGENFSRPHHHACLFNFDFEDKYMWSIREGVRLYRSDTLEKLWPFGFCTIGEVTFESASYCARYITKKINGKNKEEHYKKINYDTGELIQCLPEYSTCSRRPGIGKFWFDKFSKDLKKDFLTIGGKKYKIPKYYDKLREVNENMFDVKNKRVKEAKYHVLDNIGRRRKTKEKICKSKFKLKERKYEND